MEVSALSNWIRINKNTQIIERVSNEMAEAYKSEDQTNFSSMWLEKLKECEKIDFEVEFQADRNFIDVHNHVNNVAYLKIANLVLPKEVFDSSEPMEFEIMYRNVIKLDEKCVCLFTETDEFYNITIKNSERTELKAIIRYYK